MNEPTNNRLRALPSVDALMNRAADLTAAYGYPAALAAVRAVLEGLRERIRAGEALAPDAADILAQAAGHLKHRFQPTLRPVINATGIIIHTNLGRAPLSTAAQQAVQTAAALYNTLEFDLETGGRGSRLVHADLLLQDVTGAEAALVVNNNAAALVLALLALASGREVVISRGQLVEIGGGFRVPDVMAQSGALLREVGTTNRTRAADYERAITPETAALLRAHASNFKQLGFVESVPLPELAGIAHRHGLILIDDLGSGALLDTAAYGLEHEPTVQESIQAGADLVCFSGDKLLGGPQAGILVGRHDLIDRLKRHPLARAIRADKLCLAGLSATLEHYRKGEAAQAIPIWQMIARPLDDIRQTAEKWAVQAGGAVIAGESAVGGGSLPGETLPTALLALDVPQPDAFMERLRAAEPPVIARIAGGRVLFDPRTVLPGQDQDLMRIVGDLMQSSGG
ncbi:MAG: L-seryl-tRNA(Sec) selenium transferase [Chloroflexi bacterium]|nr:L-seryl-tRNA(Sec) selenium transferase [Chloroflexota bacterium]MDL1882921.1 L-seryl-tRNA(Sec) selenium transferase [Anaerolineae bacterium CFX8]